MLPKYRGVILLAEDDEGIRLTLKHYLEDNGFVVFVAENGVEALTKLLILLEGGKPDLVLTDINMPGDGAELIKNLCEEAYKHVPFIPMTAGGHSYISGKKVLKKPFDLTELMAEMEKVLTKDKEEKEK